MRSTIRAALILLVLGSGAPSAFANKWGQVQQSTVYIFFDVTDPASEAQGIAWWEELTAQGGVGNDRE